MRSCYDAYGYAPGGTTPRRAKERGVSGTHVSDMKQYKAWVCGSIVDVTQQAHIHAGGIHRSFSHAVLTWKDVDYIRSCSDKYGKAPLGTGVRLAKERGVSTTLVSMIKNYRIWTH